MTTRLFSLQLREQVVAGLLQQDVVVAFVRAVRVVVVSDFAQTVHYKTNLPLIVECIVILPSACQTFHVSVSSTSLTTLLHSIARQPRSERLARRRKRVDLSTQLALPLAVVVHHETETQLDEVHEERLGEVRENVASGQVGEEAPLLQLVLDDWQLSAALLRSKLTPNG